MIKFVFRCLRNRWVCNTSHFTFIVTLLCFYIQNKIKTIIKESIKQGGLETVKDNNLSVPLKEARENFEKEYLTTQLKKFGGNISKTAKFVGMERSALHRKLKGLGVKDLN